MYIYYYILLQISTSNNYRSPKESPSPDEGSDKGEEDEDEPERDCVWLNPKVVGLLGAKDLLRVRSRECLTDKDLDLSVSSLDRSRRSVKVLVLFA